ncbi:hypothetical protein ACT3TQ_10035 [Halomonas sp. AOP12-C2-37]|uniref:hypothetical protein n=1 Tax=unclassified Halomonas TaxID=2609666 RepID=UPI0040334965
MSRKKQKSKPRDTWTYFQFSHETDQIICHTDGHTVEIEGADPKYTRTVRSYERTSGKDKVEVSIPSRDGKASFSSDNQLIRQYKWLIAVDTNYKVIEDIRYACTSIYVTTGDLAPGIKEVPFANLAVYLIKEPMLGINPELIGWKLALDHVQQPACGGLVGMVVDSEADKLADFNSRTVPYLEKHYLPSHIDLIYASADKGSLLPNKMIQYCDKTASQALTHLQHQFGSALSSNKHECGLYKDLALLVPKKQSK